MKTDLNYIKKLIKIIDSCDINEIEIDEGETKLRVVKSRPQQTADQPQIIGAAALHEAQIAGVIDHAGEIRVLVVDAHLLMVLAVANFADPVEERQKATQPPVVKGGTQYTGHVCFRVRC